MLGGPSIPRGAPDGDRCAAVLLIPGSQYIKKRFSAAQHPSPVLFDLFQMREQPGRLVWIEKAGPFVEGENFIDRQRIDLDAICLIHVRQSRQALNDFLI